MAAVSDDRAAILELINQSRRRKESLPDYDEIRRRYQHDIIAAPGTTGEYLLNWTREADMLEWFEAACAATSLMCAVSA